MTKTELSQLYWLNREIEARQHELAVLRSRAEQTTSVISDMPMGGGEDGSKQERIMPQILELTELIEINIKKMFYERARLERYIDTMEDAHVRIIFRLRYINGMTIERIADEVGYSVRQVIRIINNKIGGGKAC